MCRVQPSFKASYLPEYVRADGEFCHKNTYVQAEVWRWSCGSLFSSLKLTCHHVGIGELNHYRQPGGSAMLSEERKRELKEKFAAWFAGKIDPAKRQALHDEVARAKADLEQKRAAHQEARRAAEARYAERREVLKQLKEALREANE